MDVELALVDVDVDQGLPVGEADAQRLSGDLGDATAGGSADSAGGANAAQATAQR
jgi:hypothetical protein